MDAALGRYRLATSAPAPAHGFHSRWRTVRGVETHLAAWLAAAGLAPVVVLGNSFGCQVAVELAVRQPDRVRGLVLVGPTVDPSARTALRQILRWLSDTAREDPLQLPILVRDVLDAGPRRVAGTLAHALRDPVEDKLPLVKVPALVTRGSGEPIVPRAWAQAATGLLPLGELAETPGPHNANYGAAEHLGELVLAFLHRRVLAQDDRPAEMATPLRGGRERS